MNRAAAAFFAVMALVATPPWAFAQDAARESHWGVSVSAVPRWRFPETLADIWNLETDMKGTELRAGVVRGSDRGGDWGLSFVKKTIDNDSIVQLHSSSCVQLPGGSAQCARGVYHRTQDAGMRGVEAHHFMPFASIKGRTQIGVTLAGGIAQIEGTSDRFIEHLVVNGPTVTVDTQNLGPAPFKDALQDLPREWKVVPIGRVELGVGYLVAPGFKLRASAGVNFPGFHQIGIYAQYLFGSH